MTRFIVGVDLGGTNIVVGAMSADGKQHLAMRSIPTSTESGAEGVADRIVGLIEGVILDTIAETNAARRVPRRATTRRPWRSWHRCRA